MKLLEIPEQTPAEDVDEEILEIFIEEVEEVLEEINSSFDAWKTNPADSEALQTLRRNFHTLKGSGRLVGATVIGELGWRYENMLNRVIDGGMSQNEHIIYLISQVNGVLPELIEQFKSNKTCSQAVALLISQAHHVTETKGTAGLGDFELSGDDAGSPAVEAEQETVSAPASNPVSIDIDDSLLADLEKEEAEENDLLGSTFDDTELNFDSELEELDELGDLPGDLSDNELLNNDVDLLLGDEILPIPDDMLQEDSEVDEGAPDPVLLDIFTKEAEAHLENLRKSIQYYHEHMNLPITEDLVRIFHTLHGSSLSVNFAHIPVLSAPLERFARFAYEHKAVPTVEILSLFSEAADLITSALYQQNLTAEQEHTLIEKVALAQEALEQTVSTSSGSSSDKKPSIQEDIPDATDEFMAIFLEEAEEILENTQSLLERWQTAPNNMQLMKELQRELHTLKGGARMVGITAMGDLGHRLESVLTKIVEGNAQSSSQLQDIVQTSVDELGAMLESVRNGVGIAEPDQLLAQIEAYVSGKEVPTSEAAPQKAATKQAPAAAKPAQKPVAATQSEPAETKESPTDKDAETGDNAEDRIRVRVTLIDKLTNLAGELSILRAHMEQQQTEFKTNLVEMDQTVIRLRDQLRRLEIETEAQIMSHFRDVAEDDEEFDPLEMDRFSVMQQLSRSLLESISDLSSIQDFLKTLTRQSDALLLQQSRIGAELQDGIMRTRMIPFSRISPRLQRIARLTARELRKQIDFTINGEEIEFERTVLNRVVAPLEHMLRNAIGHGIESADIRQQSGKSSMANITIDLAKEGTDLIINLSDDGAGLDLSAIRTKAEERKMIAADTVISDHELMQFILEPSFSTAKAITQVSGRGVGMDVANSEIKQLGGNLQIQSERGKGTTFEIRLPLSLTINQALMVHINEETLAIPLNNVDAVMRIPRQDVLNHENTNEPIHYKYMDHDYQVHYLGELLGFSKSSSIEKSLVPTLLIRSGDRRIALLVDAIEGSKEIVVKSVGPQISTIRWIAGATILGDGRVVLILDIPTLTRIDTSASREILEQQHEEEKKTAVTTIMVVDDSITVRKVTARLLKRQGMEVVTAKDGVDAVAQLQEIIPDLMLLDVEMPRMDGYELATQVRNTPATTHIPIIMITSRTGAKHRDRAEKIGINRYLGKPFNETELLENINALLMEQKSEVNA